MSFEGDGKQHWSWYVNQARLKCHKPGVIEVTPNAKVMLQHQGGAFVEAWVWVPDPPASSGSDELLEAVPTYQPRKNKG
jgi:hypothetical protein